MHLDYFLVELYFHEPLELVRSSFAVEDNGVDPKLDVEPDKADPLV